MLTLRETASACFDWNSGEETTVDAATNTTLTNPFTVAVPGNPDVTEQIYSTTDSAGVKSKAIVTWGPSDDAFVETYQLKYNASASSTYLVITSIRGLTQEIPDLAPGFYNFRVKAFNGIGVGSDYSSVVTKELAGLSAPPASITGFYVIASNGYAQVSWTLSTDLDVQINGSVIIRHSAKTSGAVWEDGIILDVFPGGAVQGTVALVTGTYMAKAVDSTGTYSTTMTGFVATEGMTTGFTTVATSTQAAGFTGAKTNVSVSESVLQLTSHAVAQTGEHLFNAPLDMGTVATRRFEADIEVLSYVATDLIDSRGNIDDWSAVDGSTVDDCDVTLYAATTQTDPAGSPVWSAWTPFNVADFT